MDAMASRDEQALRARLTQARERLDGLVRDLHAVDAELEDLAPQRTQHRLLHTACAALEELAELGVAELFWGGRTTGGEGDDHLRRVRSRVDGFEKRLIEIEDRRQAVLEGRFSRHEGTFKIDPSQNPATIDLILGEGGRIKRCGIYRVEGDRLVVGGRDKMVHAISKDSGRPIWTFTTRARVDSSPVIARNRVYVGGNDGKLYVLDLQSGKSVFEFEAGGPLSASPAIASSRLVIGSQDGKVFCLG